MKMEQATTGKAPPSIALNSGGGIQILNMNAVRGAAVGATVVPSPGSAQKGTVVGSPGPPGNAVGVGPRMISITPQMLATSGRPGQPVDEQSDSGSVNPSEELNTSSGQSCSPASITGVSCDLIAVNYDECEKGKVKDDDDNGSENGFVNTSDIHVEGNNRSNESPHGVENDLSPSPTADGNSVEVSWSPKNISERSVDSHPISPSLPLSGERTDCDENENLDCKLGRSGSDVQQDSSRASTSSVPEDVDSLPCKDVRKLEKVDVIDIVRERLSVIHGAQEVVRVAEDSSRNGSVKTKESDMRGYESEVPIPVNTSDDSEKADSCQSERSSSDFNVSTVSSSKYKQSQNCVQADKMDLIVKSPISCDNTEKSVLTVTSGKDKIAEDAGVLTSRESDPPPLVHDDNKDSSAGNDSVLTRGDSTSSVDPVDTVDDVNLDMFADPLDADNVVQLDRPQSEESRKSNEGKSKDAADIEENEDSRPKLMDMNLADYMCMDFDEDDAENHCWNQPRPTTIHQSSTEPPFSPPKVSTPTSSGVTPVVSTELIVPSSSNNSGINTWTASRITSQVQEAPPSCAFQLYTVGQGQQTNRMPNSIPTPVAARIPMRNEAFHQQQQLQSVQSRYSQPAYSAPTTVSSPHSSRANITNVNSTTNNTSFEYKANDSQSYFTADPQLHSQFLQYTKNFPLSSGSSNNPEVRHLSPGATVHGPHHVPSQQDLHAKQFTPAIARPMIVPQQHQLAQNSSRNPPVQPQQRQVYPGQQYHHGVVVQQPLLQSQSHSNPAYRSNMNGCDISKQVYNNTPLVRLPFQSRSVYVGQGQISTLSNIRPTTIPGVYPPMNVPTSTNPHPQHVAQMQTQQRHPMQKDMSSCAFAGSQMQQSSMPMPYTYAGTAVSVSHPTISVATTYPVATANYGQAASGVRHQVPQVNLARPSLSTFQTVPSSSAQVRGIQYKISGSTPGGWNIPTVVSQNNPLSSYTSNPTTVRATTTHSTYPYSSQNLGARETGAFKPEVQTVNRMPYTDPSSIAGPQQYRYPQLNYSTTGNRPQVPQPQGPRMPSVIARYPSSATQSAGSKTDGGSAWNEINHYNNSQQKQMMSSSMPSPQMLRNPNYIAQFRNPSSGVQQQDSSSMACQSVIRPTFSGSNLVTRSGIGAGTQVMVGAQSANVNSNNNRQFYGNQPYQQMSSSSSSQQHHYYGNQASVIRAPQSSSISSSSNNNSNSNVSSCSAGVKGVNQSGYQGSSSSGYVGDLTLQSFLSNPSAPFISPPSSSERSSTTGSGYSNESMGWGSERPYRDGGVSTEDYPFSSCQYSDAMRRYNAPITLQALSGLPPGANHLLVKTENGQFQLVSVRMPAPPSGPGTQVVPSTAPPTTSMSIAQQLPSNSPLAPSHSVPSGPPLPPNSSIITTTTIPPHPSQQGRIITSSSSNHIVTSWSSTPINSVINNSTASSPLPISSSTAPIPHPPHLAPPISTSSHHPPPPPPSVIMPPNLSASNSQLLSTANNISSTSSTTFSTAAAAAAFNQQQHRPPHSVVMSNIGGGPPPPIGLPPPPLPNSMSAGQPLTMNNIPGSVIRTGILGTSSLPPPPPPIVVNSTSSSASSVTSSTPTGGGGVNPLNSNLPSAPPSSATFRPPPPSQVPNNNATSNAQSGVGMMMTASNNSVSIQPHQIHPQYSPHPQAPHYSSNTYASNTANSVSQMSNETAKTKCKNFLSFLLELSAKQNQTVARNVKNLIQGLIDGKVNEENFSDRLQKEVNSQPQPCLVGFLKKSLPHLRHSLATNELKIEGIKPPPLSTFVPPAPITPLVPAPQTPPTPTERKPSKGSSSKSKSNSASNSLSASGANSASSGPGASPSSKSSIPSTSKSSKEKEKKDKTFSSSGYSADDDINDVAAMGGVNLAEESQKILGSTEFVGTQIRSCRDETFIHASPIISKFKTIAAKYGLDETPSQDLTALLSHAVEERLKTLIEKLSVIAEHRMDVIKLDDRYEVTQDIKGQLRFLEELDKLERKRHDEQEREMLIRAAKSRSKSEDPEQAKLKAKAKEMQRVQLEEMRQRDANLTALQAIGPRKKPKLDMGGSHGSAVPSPLGASGASGSLGRPQMALRPRLKRVNLRDLLFLLEHDKETMRSPFLYRNLLLK